MARVLIIDDEDGIRAFLRSAFERAGYEVIDAKNGEVGLRTLKSSSVDLVITDMIIRPGTMYCMYVKPPISPIRRPINSPKIIK